MEANDNRRDINTVKFSYGGIESFCAFATSDSLSYQFHPESVGTTCPQDFFDAMRLFLYNKVYEQKPPQV